MMTSTPNRTTQVLMLQARTAAELMTTNPQSLRQDATVGEAAAFLSTRGFGAAPVIDEAGRPVGVVSRTDLLHHHGQKAVRLLAAPLGRGDGGSEPGATGARGRASCGSSGPPTPPSPSTTGWRKATRPPRSSGPRVIPRVT